MNAGDVLKYGHLDVLGAVDGLDPDDWHRPGVCGEWSVKEIIAHLASYELLMVDVCRVALGEGATPAVDELLATGEAFNDNQVNRRREQSVDETLAEYRAAHELAAALLAQIPLERRRQAGFLPWYGADYDLEDVLAYLNYGHKREHCAQIAVFRGRLIR